MLIHIILQVGQISSFCLTEIWHKSLQSGPKFIPSSNGELKASCMQMMSAPKACLSHTALFIIVFFLLEIFISKILTFQDAIFRCVSLVFGIKPRISSRFLSSTVRPNYFLSLFSIFLWIFIS